MNEDDRSDARQAQREIEMLSPFAKAYLNHHIRNSLNSIMGYNAAKMHEKVEDTVMRLVDHLHGIGLL